MSAEMTDGKLRWVVVGFVFFVGVAYFVWLCMIYVKFVDTNRRIMERADAYYTRDSAPEYTETVEDIPTSSDETD